MSVNTYVRRVLTVNPLECLLLYCAPTKVVSGFTDSTQAATFTKRFEQRSKG